MKTHIQTYVLLVAFFSCSFLTFSQNNIHIDSLWQELVFEKGGCLTGGQSVRNGHFGSEACIMTDYARRGKKWKLFFELPKDSLTSFLIGHLSDTATTRIHTCPCYKASAGEVAVYALQNIYKINWYDLEPFKEYAEREGFGCEDGPQSWLNEIIEDKDLLRILIEAWLDKSSYN